MLKHKKIFFIFVFSTFLILFLFSFICADIVISDEGVKYDSEILSSFEELSLVEVSFEIINMSYLEDIMNSLDDGEFYLIDVSYPNIYAQISKEGFDKLIMNSLVKSINYEVQEISVYVDPKIEEMFQSSDWIRVFCNVLDVSYMESIKSSFFDSELVFVRNSSNLVVVEVNEDGLNKLIEMPGVTSVYYDSVGTTAHGNASKINSSIETNGEESKEVITSRNKINKNLYLYSIIFILLIFLILFFLNKRRIKK